MSNLHVFKHDQDGVKNWIVAASVEDATALLVSHGWDDEAVDPDVWERLPDEQELSIAIEDEGKIAKPCAEWARENGRGFLASTEA